MPASKAIFFAALALLLGSGRVSGQTFGPPISVELDPQTGVIDVALGDIDEDGLQDIVGAYTPVFWLRQTGPLTFAPRSQIAASAHARQIRLADIDGDGDLDVVVMAWSPLASVDSLTWFENLGAGASWVPHFVSNAKTPFWLETSDFDVDGDVDLFMLTTQNDELLHFENLGGGAFAALQAVPGSSGDAQAFAFGNLNGDGLPDLVLRSSTQSSVYLGNQAGSFVVSHTTVESVVGIDGQEIVDVNGDGFNDVVGRSMGIGGLSWFAGDGQGNLTEQPSIPSVPFMDQFALGDFDFDDDLDIVFSQPLTKQVMWIANDGLGHFGSATVLATNLNTALAKAADLNADGLIDVLTGSFQTEIFVLKNLTPGPLPTLSGPAGLHCAQSGTLTWAGENLLGATAAIDGTALSVLSSSDTTIELFLEADIPGGLRSIDLTNGFGTTPAAALVSRYPVLEAPATLLLGEPGLIAIDNGDVGLYSLAISPGLFSGPAPFAGWYHGLELNGVLIQSWGQFTPGATSRTISLPPTSEVALVGTTIYVQAWTSQDTLGLAGFTRTAAIEFQAVAP